jgi:hypothetical protein
LATLCDRNRGDDEAVIFHALQLVAIGYLAPADKTYAWQKKGAEILNQVLVRRPNHPGVAHYIIHSVDYPSVAEVGLKAAHVYATIAPDAPHALHMPSHIFTRLGLWDDSIASNTASMKSAIAQAQRLHGGGGSFDQLHAMDYLVYAYLQQAKDASARKALADMEAITKLDENQFAAAYAFAASPARWLSSGTIGKLHLCWRSSRHGFLGTGFVTRKRSSTTREQLELPVQTMSSLRAVQTTNLPIYSGRCRPLATTIGAETSARSGKQPRR